MSLLQYRLPNYLLARRFGKYTELSMHSLGVYLQIALLYECGKHTTAVKNIYFLCIMISSYDPEAI